MTVSDSATKISVEIFLWTNGIVNLSLTLPEEDSMEEKKEQNILASVART